MKTYLSHTTKIIAATIVLVTTATISYSLASSKANQEDAQMQTALAAIASNSLEITQLGQQVTEALESFQKRNNIIDLVDRTSLDEDTVEVLIEEMVGLVESVRNLESDLADLRYDVSSYSAIPDSQTGNGDNHLSGYTEQEFLTMMQEERQDFIATQESAFISEEVDPTWATNTSSTIENAMSQEMFSNSSLQDIECRASRCRVTTNHKDLETYGVFELEFSVLMSETMPASAMSMTEEADGSVTSTMYLSQ